MTTTDSPRNPLLTKRGLPKYCPSWCEGQHKESLAEGCSVESARVHMSGDLGGLLHDLHNYIAKRLDRAGNGGWGLKLTQDVTPDGHSCVVAVALEVHTRDIGSGRFTHQTLELTTSEARTLAAQLLHFANLEELHRYDYDNR